LLEFQSTLWAWKLEEVKGEIHAEKQKEERIITRRKNVINISKAFHLRKRERKREEGEKERQREN
jgi:hypothetical protein